MTDQHQSQNNSADSSSNEAHSRPGNAEQSASFLANLRSSYTPSSGLGYYGGGGGRTQPRNLRTSFQMPTQGNRFALAATFSFDENSVTTIDGEKLPHDEDGEEGARRHTERLKTGDTLRQLPDQEILEFKNKDRLIIYKSLGWIMEDGKGNPITRQIIPSLENPGDNSTFSLDKGGNIIAQVIEFSGITTIVFQNSDKIIFDLSGVCSIARKKDAVYLREPIRKLSALSHSASRAF